jgi:activator of 2-hydroxyglutaryl-CoA dehydratase
MICGNYMGRKKKQKKKLTTLRQIQEYLNDKSLFIRKVSREVFMGVDIGTRTHKDKKKYNRKKKHKKRLDNDG